MWDVAEITANVLLINPVLRENCLIQFLWWATSVMSNLWLLFWIEFLIFAISQYLLLWHYVTHNKKNKHLNGCCCELQNLYERKEKSNSKNLIWIINPKDIFIAAGCLGKSPATVMLMQITAVSSLSSHSVTDDANNEHFIFGCTTSSRTTEMKYIGRDELLPGDLSWQANRKYTNEQLANLALINNADNR